TQAGVVTKLAGKAGLEGSADGAGSSARFRRPAGVGIDNAGNVYVSDSGNNTIRKITSVGEVTTLAGMPGKAGTADGFREGARFNSPEGLTLDNAGNLFVADLGNDMIRKVTPEGVVTTLAGSMATPGLKDGTGS